jgi:hypothetical protein
MMQLIKRLTPAVNGKSSFDCVAFFYIQWFAAL